MSETKFNPKDHIIDMRGKDYLEVKWRLVWFKEENPKGSISTEILNTAPVLAKATIFIDGLLVATGHGSATPKGNSVWSGREIEKAETAAIGRALAHAGYGTQFTDEDETDNIVDSPIEKKTVKQDAPNIERVELVKEFSQVFNGLKSKAGSVTINGSSTIEQIQKAIAHNKKLAEAQYEAA